MPPTVKPPPPILLTVAAWACIAGGAFAGGLFVYKALVSAKPPPAPLTVIVILAAAVDCVLGVGLLRRGRVAWSFALALHIVGLIVCVLSIPAMTRAGLPPLVAPLPGIAMMGMVTLLGISSPSAKDGSRG